MTKRYSVYLASLFLLIAIGFWSCGPGDTPDQEAAAEAASVPEPVVEPAGEPEPVPPPEVAPTVEPMAEPSAKQIWEETVWVAGKEGKLVLGLDQGEYDPYSVTTVQKVQQALTSKGLYSGPISGVLDKATMEALAEFQKSNNLQACGVPTPRTREALLQP